MPMRQIYTLLSCFALISGCSFVLDWSDEGRPCSATQPCSAGFVCAAGSCRGRSDGGTAASGLGVVASLAEGRSSHTATLLPSGKVLVAGGNGPKPLKTVEIFDPSSKTWSVGEALSASRAEHAATLLFDNRVLVTGGREDVPDSALLATAEIFDEATGKWTAAASMSAARSFHTASALLDGRVVLAGGYPTGAVTETYNPSSNTWSPSSKPLQDRFHHRAVRLGDQLFILGGRQNQALAETERLDLTSFIWSSRASMQTARSAFMAARLSGDRILVAGGFQPETNTYLGVAEIYDATANKWTATGSLVTERAHSAVAVLADGKVLVAGGQNASGKLRSIEVFDPESGKWSAIGELSVARSHLSATKTLENTVLFVGGETASGASNVAELYVP